MVVSRRALHDESATYERRRGVEYTAGVEPAETTVKAVRHHHEIGLATCLSGSAPSLRERPKPTGCFCLCTQERSAPKSCPLVIVCIIGRHLVAGLTVGFSKWSP
jgi:hypothetical protein